ncbi:MAG TPA: precorrin-6y C5,15-methyltransferase (decarboxylating) subunit CbiE [Verrucomicrobiae bacterium]|nr:precorrin-6y C5,15-methyltransferase (decarboxylating) subunit CbiE [Verrucomicrobiae bacterium]
MAKLYIVGAGPGSPDYVTPAARKAVQGAQIVIGAECVLDLFREDIKSQTLTLTCENIDETLRCALDSVKSGKTVAVISTGDPGFSGLLGSFLRRSMGENVEVNVIPGISSILACAAKLCISWDDAVLITFHKGASIEGKREFADAVKAGKTVMLLPDPASFNLGEISKYLLNAGVNKETVVIVCENLTLANEKIVETTLEGALNRSFDPTSVMVIKGNPNKKRIT